MNKGRKRVVFQPGDWVWVHFRKERFSNQRKSKLHARGDGPFHVIERINDNAYRLDLPGDYNVSATFNVADLSIFDADDDFDSRTNPFEEGGNDVNHNDAKEAIRPSSGMDGGTHGGNSKMDGSCLNHEDNVLHDDLKLPQGPITRSRAKKFKEALQGFMRNIWDNHAHEDPIRFEGLNGSLIEAKWALCNILEVQILSE